MWLPRSVTRAPTASLHEPGSQRFYGINYTGFLSRYTRNTSYGSILRGILPLGLRVTDVGSDDNLGKLRDLITLVRPSCPEAPEQLLMVF